MLPDRLDTPLHFRKGKVKGEFTLRLTNLSTNLELDCRVIQLPKDHHRGDELLLLVLPLPYGRQKAFAYVLYRDRVISGEPAFLIDQLDHPYWNHVFGKPIPVEG